MKFQDRPTTHNTIRIAVEEDVVALTALCRKTFLEAYEADNSPENMRHYLDTHFSEPLILKELTSLTTWIFVSESVVGLNGYLVLKKADPPDPVAGHHFIEIARFYVDQDFQGMKVGAGLMRSSLHWAKKEGFDSVWLAVWQQNLKAVAIYEHFGFKIAGATVFELGDDVQLDHVMLKNL